MKEYLQENQPKFYNLIKNEFIQNKIPHAFLLVGNNTKLVKNVMIVVKFQKISMEILLDMMEKRLQ